MAAVRRVLIGLDPDFRVQTGDELIVAGTDEDSQQFVERLG